MKKRNFFRFLFGVFQIILMLIIFGSSASFAAKDFPNKEIEIVVPYPPGGVVDVGARIIGNELSKNFSVPILIINKGGGEGIIGVEYVARSKPDGHTILAMNNSLFVILPITQSDFPYRTSDFRPIARYASTPNVVVVRKEAPWKTLEELIAYAKKNPGKMTCASPGVGTVGHLVLEMLKLEANVDIQHVPFKGGAQVVSAVLGGHVDFLAGAFPAMTSLIKSGDFKALASTKKIPGFPGIPSFADKGYAGVNLVMWNGFFAPKGVEITVMEKILKGIEKTLKNPQVIKKLDDIGWQSDYISGKDLVQVIEKECKELEDVIKKANLKF